uniref:ABC-type xenobiotic transporter n=1 Tax=Macrostomum lignano TaxID=282301 RepID=A0A1I8HCF8_9PLAT
LAGPASVAVITQPWRCAETPPKPPLARRPLLALLRAAFGVEYAGLGALKLFADVCAFCGPLALNWFVGFLEATPGQRGPDWWGGVCVAALVSSTLLAAAASTAFNYRTGLLVLKARSALASLVYRKTLNVPVSAMGQYSSGQALNFLSTDADRIVNFCPSFHQLWSMPLQIVVVTALLWYQVGWVCLVGLAFTLLLLPVNRLIAVKIEQQSAAMMKHKDRRVKLTGEVLRGIRPVKLWAWEEALRRRIRHHRRRELRALKWRKYLDALCVYFWAATPVAISLLTFVAYSLLGNPLTAAKAFTCIALFGMLITPLNALPWVVNGLMEARVSLRRVDNFLRCREMPPQSEAGEWIVSAGCLRVVCGGQFIGIVGPVGSGKSSLLLAVQRELRKLNGDLRHSELLHCGEGGEGGGIAYVSQEPWLQRGSVQDNILFGAELEPDWLSAVIRACGLQADLPDLPRGLHTEVGEGGQSLSGGQRARVALARAVYQRAEVYLLDDPLASVDARTASRLVERCFLGLLRDRTRVLVTHRTGYLAGADWVFILADGRVVDGGPPARVFGSRVGNEDRPQPPAAAPAATTADEDAAADTDADADIDLGDDPDAASGLRLPRRRRRTTLEDSGGEADQLICLTDGSDAAANVRADPAAADDEAAADGTAADAEAREFGSVDSAVYLAYAHSVGWLLAAAVLLSLVLMQVRRSFIDLGNMPFNGSRNASDLWLAAWTGNRTGHSTQFYLAVYGGLAGANSVFTLARALLFARGGLRAAQLVHKQLLLSVLRAPVQFFDSCPLGRLVNRFSSDLYTVDDTLPFQLNILLAQLTERLDLQAFGLAGTLTVICLSLPAVLLLLLPLACCYWSVQDRYRATSRELKRINSVALSPLYSHYLETLAGLPVIRGHGRQSLFLALNRDHLGRFVRAGYSATAVAAWLQLRLQLLGVAVVAGVVTVAMATELLDSADAGLVGLASAYAMGITGALNGVVTYATETEKEMVAMERLLEYSVSLPNEEAAPSSQELSLRRIGQPLCLIDSFNPVCGAPQLRDFSCPAAPNGVAFHHCAAINAAHTAAELARQFEQIICRMRHQQQEDPQQQLRTPPAQLQQHKRREVHQQKQKMPQHQDAEVHQRKQKMPQHQDEEVHQRKQKMPQHQDEEVHQRKQKMPQHQDEEVHQRKQKMPQHQDEEVHQRKQKMPQHQDKEVHQQKQMPQHQDEEVHQRKQKMPQHQDEEVHKRKQKMPQQQEAQQCLQVANSNASNQGDGRHCQPVCTEPSELRLVLRLEAWIDDCGSLMVQPSIHEDLDASAAAEAPAIEQPDHLRTLTATEASIFYPSWPRSGSLEFSNVSLRYRAAPAPRALSHVTFSVAPGDRLAIVGRTGSGKTSLLRALFRTVELDTGRVTVDGLDIRRLARANIRSRLAIIPQEPFLFDASLRENLDPAGEFSYEELEAAIERCRLRGLEARLAARHGGCVGEAGRCLSAGQRQLVCLARALLRRAPLVCLDEATACVDADTEAEMQRALLQCLSGVTLLVIAHRLETVASLCTSVIVLSGGRVVEQGCPEELLRNPRSELYRLFATDTRRRRSRRSSGAAAE